MKSKTAMRASIWVLKLRRLSSSHSSVAKEALAQGVVEAVSHRVHRRPHCGLATTLASLQRWPKASEVYLTALVGMVDYADGTPLPERHVERLERQLGEISLHRPAHHTPAEDVEHHGEIEKDGSSGDLG